MIRTIWAFWITTCLTPEPVAISTSDQHARGRHLIACLHAEGGATKLAITVDSEIHENILAAATRDGVSVSAWMTNAAREALQRRAGLAAVDQWERQHGRLTQEEMNEARRRVLAQQH